MTNQIAKFDFKGTAKDFEDYGVTLNGVALDKITVANLAKHGLLVAAGEGKKPTRGRTPQMFGAVSRDGFTFEVTRTPPEPKVEDNATSAVQESNVLSVGSGEDASTEVQA